MAISLDEDEESATDTPTVASASVSPKTLEILRYIASGYNYEQIVELGSLTSYEAIFEACREAAERLSTTQPSSPSPTAYQQHLKEMREKHPNAYVRWSKEADAKLTQLFEANYTVPALTKVFGRHRGAIRARLRKLGLIEGEVE